MKVYSVFELERLCDRASSEEQFDVAEKFIKSRPYLSESEKSELLEYLDGAKTAFELSDDEDYYDDRDYSPSAPWNAPGMKVSDFIRGVKCW